MARFKLYIEYDGTRYSGWQLQKNAKTIQGVLLKAAYEIFKVDNIELQGSGRTDGGVHALCQVGHMDVKTMLAPEIIRMKFNDILPPDINIIEVEKTNPKFHARHDAVSRSYVYIISKRRTSFNKNYVWWIKDSLDFAKINQAAQLFKGMHDYKSFADKDSEEKSTKVLIHNVECTETANLIYIRIIGSHFLWKMVRRMVGILAEIGRGKKTKEDLKDYLFKYSTEPAKATAPPSGLFLENVYYQGDKISEEFKIPLPNL
ncbi:MAG: tRNA pseudouridine(38-40) synthase TruA [Bacteroidota bacterium]|nr:tRNA pseudouridine(38-40) synthase TruA [Bacteroidota bacterium]